MDDPVPANDEPPPQVEQSKSMEQFAADDQDTIRRIFEQVRSELCKIATDRLRRRHLSASHADDIVQKALVIGWKRYGKGGCKKVQSSKELKRLLRGITRNVARDFCRKMRARKRDAGREVPLHPAGADQIDSDFHAGLPDPALVAVVKDLYHQFNTQLTEDQRFIFTRAREGWPREWIADQLGVSRATVVRELHYIRTLMKRCLSGGPHDAAD